MTSHRSPVHYPDGFAVRGGRAVLTRRHHNKRTVDPAPSSTGHMEVTERRTLDVPGRVVMRCGQGRDGTLWLRTGDTWLHAEA